MTQETEALFVVGRAWSEELLFQKLTPGPVYQLTACGDIEVQREHEFPEHLIYLEGPDELCASWLQQARDLHPHLHRGNGWILRLIFFILPGRNVSYVRMLWCSTEEALAQEAKDLEIGLEPARRLPIGASGPLQDIGVVFLRWRAALPPERRAPAPPGAEWKPLFDQEGLIQCEEGELCIFAVSVSTNDASPAWEYFIDSVVWDAETEPSFHEDQAGWGLDSGLLFVPVSKVLPALPPLPTHSEEEGGTS